MAADRTLGAIRGALLQSADASPSPLWKGQGQWSAHAAAPTFTAASPPVSVSVSVSRLPFSTGWRITLAMFAKVCSAAVNGIEAHPVEVEVKAGYGDTIIVIIESISPSLARFFFASRNLISPPLRCCHQRVAVRRAAGPSSFGLCDGFSPTIIRW